MSADTTIPFQTRRTEPATTSAPGQGLLAEYFDNPDGTDLKTVRIDPKIDFSWGRGLPPNTALTPPDTWSGFIEAPVTGTYTFTTSDDGIRLWVDGKRIIDRWTVQKPTDNHGTINLLAGQRYSLVIEYFEGFRSATAKLWWTYPGQAKQIVPQRHLYPAVGAKKR